MRKQLISVLILFFVSSSLFSAGGRVVRDVWNRDVEIPSVVTSIVALGSMGPRMASYLGVVDMLVGAEDLDINGMSARYDYSPVYHDELEKLPSVGKGAGSGENNAYVEELIMLQPDVIIAGFDKAACDELERTTGIPVVSIRYRMNGFVDEGFYRALRIFTSVVGKEEHEHHHDHGHEGIGGLPI